MDQIDREIIKMLQRNARTPLKAIAQEVHLSIPAVSARVERMEREHVICGYTMLADPVKMGYHITAFINMELKPEQKEGFCRFIRGIKNVAECSHITGAYSMLIKVLFPSTMELDQFVGKLQKYGKTQTQIVFSSIVSARSVGPLEEKEEVKEGEEPKGKVREKKTGRKSAEDV